MPFSPGGSIRRPATLGRRALRPRVDLGDSDVLVQQLAGDGHHRRVGEVLRQLGHEEHEVGRLGVRQRLQRGRRPPHQRAACLRHHGGTAQVADQLAVDSDAHGRRLHLRPDRGHVGGGDHVVDYAEAVAPHAPPPGSRRRPPRPSNAPPSGRSLGSRAPGQLGRRALGESQAEALAQNGCRGAAGGKQAGAAAGGRGAGVNIYTLGKILTGSGKIFNKDNKDPKSYYVLQFCC